jgi:hypothetical protein
MQKKYEKTLNVFGEKSKIIISLLQFAVQIRLELQYFGIIQDTFLF